MITERGWKRLAAILIQVIAVCGCALMPTRQASLDQILTVEDPVYDFAYAGPEQTVSHEFTFTNKGNRLVSIKKVAVCCGCNAPVSDRTREAIAPGQSAKILVACTLPRYEGPVEKVINLQIDAGEAVSIPLTIKGQIERDLVVLPPSLSFGRMRQGEAAQMAFRVLQMSGERLEIERVEANPDYYTVETIRFDEPNHRGYDIVVGFSADVPAGIHSDLLSIHTNNLRRPVIDVPIMAQVVE